MNPLLLAGSLAIAKQSLGRAVHRTMLGFAAYSMLIVCGAVAIGFLTVAGFLQLTAVRSALFASTAIALAYAALGVLGLVVLLFLQRRAQQAEFAAPIRPVAGVADVATGNGIPSGIAAASILVVVGCLFGRSMARRRQ